MNSEKIRPSLRVPASIKKLFVMLALIVVISSLVITPVRATIAPCICSHGGHITYKPYTNYGTTYSTALSNAATLWNSAISNAGVSSFASLSYVASGNYVTAYFTTNSSPNVYGEVKLYGYSNYNGIYELSLTSGEQWNTAKLYVYPSNIQAVVQSEPYLLDTDYPACLLKTTVHEFGHILGLMHPQDQCWSVMFTGVSTSYTPTSYDEADIYSRWH